MEMLNVKVNGIAVSVPKGATILEAARAAGVEIPTLCYMKEKNEIGACRICVVEATGARGLVTACVYPVTEGMEISTNTPKVRAARKTTLELILSTHDKNCPADAITRTDYIAPGHKLASFTIDTSKCVKCGACVAGCKFGAISKK